MQGISYHSRAFRSGFSRGRPRRPAGVYANCVYTCCTHVWDRFFFSKTESNLNGVPRVYSPLPTRGDPYYTIIMRASPLPFLAAFACSSAAIHNVILDTSYVRRYLFSSADRNDASTPLVRHTHAILRCIVLYDNVRQLRNICIYDDTVSHSLVHRSLCINL